MENIFEHNVKLENHVITKLLEQNDKRALFIYTYALRWNIERPCVTTQISLILELLGKRPVASNIKSVKESLNILVRMNLIKVFSDITLDNSADINSLKKNDQIYIIAKEPLSEENYTLVKTDYVDKTMINRLRLEREDMVATVLLLSRNIERKDEVLQICWYSSDKLSKELRIRKSRYFELIDGLKELEVIYFEKLVFEEKDKEHLIYSMFGDKEHVTIGINKAKKLGVLDKRVKSSNKDSDENILIQEELDGEIVFTNKTYKDEDILEAIYQINIEGELLGLTHIELNHGSVEVINKVYKKHGKDILLKALKNVGLETTDKDNPTGYMVKMLPIRAVEISNQLKISQTA
ncbi:hypothetical protein [Halobacillus sp. BBL2006]|uniref:hypothetical protein n=1 Tax=Halobacillus sp. BBL2006 TaxID=1543706 RepID=UPI0005419BD1|nr:hypothetical protein [Halobacillus sp. BBL2006]KHE72317.1 hypothetical protein LD39_05210 [Halobacillus sp. BBL2006]